MAQKLGLSLMAVDSSYTALVRGLVLSEISQEEVKEDKPWCVLIITPNSFVVISILGNKIIEITEDPLAVRSFNPEDIYPNIASYSMESIVNKNPDHLVFISESDDVSAEVLSTYFDLTCRVSFIEENKFRKESLFPQAIDTSVGFASFASIVSIGSSCWGQANFPINFNLLEEDLTQFATGFKFNIRGVPIAVNLKLIEYILIGLGVLSFIALTATYFICSSINVGLANTYKEYYAQSVKLQQEVENQNSSTKAIVKIDAVEIENSVYDTNKKILESYAAISQEIPEKLWVEYLEVHDNLTTNIKGKAYSVEDIINYYQNLNKIAKFKNFKISFIKVVGQDTPAVDRVTIVPNSSPEMELPALPNLPNLSAEKYYLFQFGSSDAPPVSTPAAGLPSATSPPSAAGPPPPPQETPETN
jgi:hypothetical protein